MTKQVIIASNNAHKIDEIRTALDFEGWKYVSLKEANIVSSPDEIGETFVENARIKARAVFEQTGSAVLADDSGLAVDYLDGMPGVYSSRFSGVEGDDTANNAKLLQELAQVSDEQRTARFVCALVFIDEDGVETVAEGSVEGRIGYELQGEEGFGYDPLFWPATFDFTCTLAQVSQDEKNAISHRGNALRNLRKKLLAK